jgi:hypothetical protein
MQNPTAENLEYDDGVCYENDSFESQCMESFEQEVTIRAEDEGLSGMYNADMLDIQKMDGKVKINNVSNGGDGYSENHHEFEEDGGHDLNSDQTQEGWRVLQPLDPAMEPKTSGGVTATICTESIGRISDRLSLGADYAKTEYYGESDYVIHANDVSPAPKFIETHDTVLSGLTPCPTNEQQSMSELFGKKLDFSGISQEGTQHSFDIIMSMQKLCRS